MRAFSSKTDIEKKTNNYVESSRTIIALSAPFVSAVVLLITLYDARFSVGLPPLDLWWH